MAIVRVVYFVDGKLVRIFIILLSKFVLSFVAMECLLIKENLGIKVLWTSKVITKSGKLLFLELLTICI